MTAGPERHQVLINFFPLNGNVGLNATASVNQPTILCVVFDVIVKIGCIRRIGKYFLVLFVIFLLNASSGRHVIFCGGNFQVGIVNFVDRMNLLHQSLAKGRFAQHHATVQVLDGTGNNFRSAGAASIDQNN